MMTNRKWFQHIWIISILALIIPSSSLFSAPQFTEHVYGITSLASLAASNMNGNSTEECSVLASQYIVFADLHIIQAIISLTDKNNTGALDQLSLAQDELEEAQSKQRC